MRWMSSWPVSIVPSLGKPFVRIIHGHGTGRLRAALREYLKAPLCRGVSAG